MSLLQCCLRRDFLFGKCPSRPLPSVPAHLAYSSACVWVISAPRCNESLNLRLITVRCGTLFAEHRPPLTIMLTTLPTELSLYILRDLSLSDLANLQTVSRDVHSFLKIHEDAVYHNAAVYHRFVPATSTPDQRVELAPHRVRRRLGNASWKYLCKSILAIEHRF
jgi:hypothetical protein